MTEPLAAERIAELLARLTPEAQAENARIVARGPQQHIAPTGEPCPGCAFVTAERRVAGGGLSSTEWALLGPSLLSALSAAESRATAAEARVEGLEEVARNASGWLVMIESALRLRSDGGSADKVRALHDHIRTLLAKGGPDAE